MPKSITSTETKYSEEQIKACIALLQDLVENPQKYACLSEEQRIAFMNAAGRLSRPDRTEIRKRKSLIRQVERARVDNYERSARAATGIRSARKEAVFTAPLLVADQSVLAIARPELTSPRNCYVCKAEYTRLHFFYDAMCSNCAEFNYQKRFQAAHLVGYVALITGSRLKIGYQATLMMLRAGARVIATTRFPVDSALRYAKEKDFAAWGQRLHIYGLDLRHTPSVEIFCKYIEQTYDRLDILINNAAQTVRRPPGFYAHLLPNEMKGFDALPAEARQLLSSFEECKKRLRSTQGERALSVSWDGKAPGLGIRASAQLSQIPYAYDHGLPVEKVFPKGKLDADLQQVDLRETNSWRLRLGEIDTAELLELQLVNAIAPFVLCNKLTPLLKRDNTGKKHIVNVSAMEGKFHRYVKTDRHPHTNMAKAALNMLTHTSASDLAKSGIFMNSVDTGWVTDEDPAALSLRKQQVHDFQPPLDIVDGAARVCDPFFDGILTGKHWCGKFLKDYFPIDW
ncbi:MAG: SDR family oxidoreductase [Candidatus Omnitrophota bacterium]|nr:SDR family oxidoreductase [Candidatus Omnitrophota bacterium]